MTDLVADLIATTDEAEALLVKLRLGLQSLRQGGNGVPLTPVNVSIDGLGDSNGGPIRNQFSELPASFYTTPTLAYMNDARLSGTIIPLLAPRSATVTMTIASPCVVTDTAHGLLADAPVTLTTTGALPTGLTAGAEVYLARSPAPTANTYSISNTVGTAAVTSTGSQSGTNTATANTGIQQQSDLYAVDISANTWHTSTGGDLQYI